jgi:hypothetical protein
MIVDFYDQAEHSPFMDIIDVIRTVSEMERELVTDKSITFYVNAN